jgi:bifunctional non-homologous end joining protein LigD
MPEVAGIRISHPERLVYAERGFTKLDVARYLAQVAPRMLRHVAGRPLTLLWCRGAVPDGCAYMRHSKVWGPAVLRRVNIAEKTKVGEYLVVDDEAGLVALAQMGVVEIHTWNVTDDDIERPDRLILDLDPGPAVSWAEVVDAARDVRRALQAIGLESWVKTTGGGGLHLAVPLVRARAVSECLAFARGVAHFLAREQPARFTAAMPKRGREAKILIDYLRNNRTNTAVAAYSPRARPTASVSMPIAWSALSRRLDPAAFTLETAPQRSRRPDPWAAYFTTAQVISDDAFAALARRGHAD